MPVHGNTQGLKTAHKRALDRLGRRRVPAERIVTPELASAMALISREVGRQVGVFIDRGGQVTDVTVGDARRILLPDFGRIRAGERRFRGLRLVHTHLRSEPLSRDDLTDLTRLRLDMVVAVGVGPSGAPGVVYLAHLLPPSPGGEVHRQLGPLNVGMLPQNFLELIGSLETEFRRHSRARAVDLPEGRAVMIHVTKDRRELERAERSLDELAELARTAGVDVVERLIQVRPKPDPLYVMGRGKLEDVMVLAMQQEAELLILDCDLGPNQGRAIGEVTDLKVIDRTQLILDIFAQRAHSRDGKLKVELAQLKYLLPRLGLRDDSLSRLTGGIGGRGPGETKLEIGRRRARDRIARLEKKLVRLARARTQRRTLRRKSGIPVVSIVGYTNAGKSTLLNSLTRSEVLVENRLFATLDTASRRLRFPREREVVITDTVGFIRDLPRDLLDAFKATLEELEDATLLLHLVDASDPAHDDHIRSVERTIVQLGLERTRRLVVLNKIDLLDPGEADDETRALDGVAISANDRSTLHRLLSRVERLLWASGSPAVDEFENPV
ncbi:MAG: GTPase HflX [Deltaproteobacteria bacterium]|nr:GTPase HflX [Deltaproteobacteria bacterium]